MLLLLPDGLPNFMSKSDGWQDTEEVLAWAFDSGQLREGANQLVG